MDPILALGAAFIGGLVARIALSPSKEGGEKGKAAKSDGPERAAHPQSYVITPVNQDGSPSHNMSAVEAVRRFIV